MKPASLAVCAVVSVLFVTTSSGAQSIARVWDEEILSAIRIDTPHPPVQARNLYSVSVAMYDAWAAYDPVAIGCVFREKQTVADPAAARREAISYAAYRILRERYALSKSASNTLATLAARMTALGYPTNVTTTNTSTPAGLGNAVAAQVSAWFLSDGSRQQQAYADFPSSNGGYSSVNPPLVTGLPGANTVDVNRWQPLAIANAVDQNGFPAGPIQSFLGAHWLGVRPFALERNDATQPWINPGPQPRLNGAGDAAFREQVIQVIRRSGELTPDDGATIDISPGAFGNNALGTNDGHGYATNPVTGLPYTPNVVPRGDFGRVLAEFWADGPTSETPPGHWNTLANMVADHPSTVKRIGGMGPVVDDLEWDVKVYLALNASVHDAACAAWSLKRVYDGGRPIEYIRYMGQLGQCSDPELPSYHPSGLPLVPGVVELVTDASSQYGERHYGFAPGNVLIYAWPGQPANPGTEHSGARWMYPASWLPYQRVTFVSPAFPGYISGHSTFSRAAAEVLTAMTGSRFFPGGLGTYTAPANSYLTFERGPSATVQLQWASYYDAADQAGMSRIWGGIHVEVDDFTGRRVGSECGLRAWNQARKFFDGSITNSPAHIALRSIPSSSCELRCSTVRGMYYKLQSTTNLNEPFTDEPGGFMLATESSLVQTNPQTGPTKFYRAITALHP